MKARRIGVLEWTAGERPKVIGISKYDGLSLYSLLKAKGPRRISPRKYDLNTLIWWEFKQDFGNNLYTRNYYEVITFDSTVWLGRFNHFWSGAAPSSRQVDEAEFWIFKNNVFEVPAGISCDDAELVVRAAVLEQERKLERLRRIVELQERMDSAVSREPIPSEVQLSVWQRDGGKCVKCGSNERLEFDHIIPVSKGGANTARNIQLLCEPCNRSKSNQIG